MSGDAHRNGIGFIAFPTVSCREEPYSGRELCGDVKDGDAVLTQSNGQWSSETAGAFYRPRGVGPAPGEAQ